MTIIEALKTSVGYPVEDKYVRRILIDRELDADAQYVGMTSDFILAKADMYVLLLSVPSISEGDFSISVQDRVMLQEMAESIYRRYGKENEWRLSDSKNSLRDASNIW